MRPIFAPNSDDTRHSFVSSAGKITNDITNLSSNSLRINPSASLERVRVASAKRQSSSFLADQQSKQLRQVLYLALGERIELLLHRFATGGPHFLLKRAALGRQCDELTAGIALLLLALDEAFDFETVEQARQVVLGDQGLALECAVRRAMAIFHRTRFGTPQLQHPYRPPEVFGC